MLYVKPQFRRQGVAKAIIGCVEQYAAEEAYTGVDLEVALYNMGLAGFYEALGYRQDRVTFIKSTS